MAVILSLWKQAPEPAHPNRASNLIRLKLTIDAEAVDPGTLIALHGERGALRIVLGVRRKLQRAIAAEIMRGMSQSWLYDVNRHLNLVSALRQETALARHLVLALARRRRAA